jgi:hypothetical protein
MNILAKLKTPIMYSSTFLFQERISYGFLDTRGTWRF